MTITETIIQINSDDFSRYLPDPQKSVFFDIETTGLHRKYSRLYLLGVAFHENGDWKLRQWFSQRPSDESEILQAFLNFITDYQYIIHYNGDSFDLPYFQSRCVYSQLDTSWPERLTSIDLYRRIKPFQKLLGMDKLTLKDAERLMDIKRSDPFSGAELINLYQEYLQTGDNQLLQALLLHNSEDVLNMTRLLPLLSYPQIFEADLSGALVTQSDTEMVIAVKLPEPVPRPIEYQHNFSRLKVFDNQLIILVTLLHGELKYFYENPKDYYYLPAEDRAIHKSVGTYVDRKFRRQANQANCYQRQNGVFAPQYDIVFHPVLKADHQDKLLFFPCDKDLLPESWQGIYTAHLIDVFCFLVLKKHL